MLEIITLTSGKQIPTTRMNGFDQLGVFVAAKEVRADNLLNKFDILIQSHDGVHAVHGLDADYKAIVTTSSGEARTIYLHEARVLVAFRKAEKTPTK